MMNLTQFNRLTLGAVLASVPLLGGCADSTLNGAIGYDTYIIKGSDTIEDSDGKGFIKDQAGNILSGLIEKRPNGSYVFLGDTTVSVTKNVDLTLTFDNGNSVTIKNHVDGQLGLVCSLWNGLVNNARYGNSFDRRAA